MISQWYHLKAEALKLRNNGLSMRKIEKQLLIPRSTLSGWFHTIKLSKKHTKKLTIDWKNGLIKARQKAVIWHRAQKQMRLEKARSEALKTMEKVDIGDKNILELALAMLYLGEGFKKSDSTALGNSDPLILNFFLTIMRREYKFDISKLRCELHLRADQDAQEMKNYWANILDVPITSFKQVNFDKRTIGSKTYPHYKGVCVLRFGVVAIQRKLLYLANIFCSKVIDDYKGS